MIIELPDIKKELNALEFGRANMDVAVARVALDEYEAELKKLCTHKTDIKSYVFDVMVNGKPAKQCISCLAVVEG